MGYRTCYSIKVIEGDSNLIQELRKECDYARDAFEEEGNSSGEGFSFWDHEEDLKYFSSKHPEAVFQLYGEGEESTDIWYKYFKNGKMQVCEVEITFDEYDESKLE